MNDAAIVVLPSWVEHQPRRLLAALAAGIPAICNRNYAVSIQAGLSLVQEGDSAGLRAAIASTVCSSTRPAPDYSHAADPIGKQLTFTPQSPKLQPYSPPNQLSPGSEPAPMKNRQES
jgi:hypothetical protein